MIGDIYWLYIVSRGYTPIWQETIKLIKKNKKHHVIWKIFGFPSQPDPKSREHVYHIQLSPSTCRMDESSSNVAWQTANVSNVLCVNMIQLVWKISIIFQTKHYQNKQAPIRPYCVTLNISLMLCWFVMSSLQPRPAPVEPKCNQCHPIYFQEQNSLSNYF
jgi:hypothetical protein